MTSHLSDRSSIWGSSATTVANRSTVFISWESPPPGFVKVNFDGSVRGRMAGADFVIRDPDGLMMAASGRSLIDTYVPWAKLHVAWAGITYATRILDAQRLYIEGDSATVIDWIRPDAEDRSSVNPLIHDIRSASIWLMRFIVIMFIKKPTPLLTGWLPSLPIIWVSGLGPVGTPVLLFYV